MKRNLIVIIFFVCCILYGCTSPVNDVHDEEIRPNITISSDTIWPAKSTYHISCDLYLKAFLAIGDSSLVIVDSTVTIYVGSDSDNPLLTIGKGSTFTFGKAASIMIGANGSFIAHGNSTSLIKFTRDSTTSIWGSSSGGIRINGNNRPTGQISLTYCLIEYATIGINDSSSFIELSNSTIKNCRNEGVIFNCWQGGPKDSASFLNNVITENGSYPITFTYSSNAAAYVGNLSGTGNFSGNVKDGIFVSGGTIYPYATAVWKKHNVPYLIKYSLNLSVGVSEILTIRPGCRLEFDSGGIKIGWDGSLIADGTVNDPIIFTRCNTDQHWSGIMVDDILYGQAIFNHCVIEYANTGIASGSPITISNCIIRNCVNQGISFSKTRNFYQQVAYGSPKDSASFLNNIDTGNGSYALSIYANRVGLLSGSGVFSGNKINGILVHGDIVDKSSTWKKHDVPYVVDSCVDVESSGGTQLTIAHGCKFEFTKIGSCLQVGYNNKGTLIAEGLPTDSIIFSKCSTTDFWGLAIAGIRIGNSATLSTSLRYCNISYSTNGLYIDAAVSIQNCYIHDNRQYGIYFSASGLDNYIMNNTFSNNLLGDIYQ
jgi:hypothetical protein